MTLQLKNSRVENDYVLNKLQILENIENYNSDETCNVKYYGAVGDGITDDTDAIQQCIDENDDYVIIPFGVYLLKSGLVIDGKTNFCLHSENASLLFNPDTMDESYAISITDCNSFTTTGHMILASGDDVDVIALEPVMPSMNNGIYVQNGELHDVKSINIIGPFRKGMLLGVKSNVGSIFGIYTPMNYSNIIIEKCVNAIEVTGEYYNIVNVGIQSSRCGILITGGNNSVCSSVINSCRIGIYVLGGGPNSDHGKIVGCTVNHCIACAILVRNTYRSQQITGCEVWATLGDFYPGYGFLPKTLTADELNDTSAIDWLAISNKGAGIFLENCELINVNAVTFGGNHVHIGISGLVTSTICGNMFTTGENNTYAHIKEFDGLHDVYGRNAQNIISNNVFAGTYKTGGIGPPMFFKDTLIENEANSYVLFKDNLGTYGPKFLDLSADSAATTITNFDGNFEYLILSMKNAAQVKLHPSLTGYNFKIIIINKDTGYESKTIKLPVGYTSTFTPLILVTGVTYSNGTYTFTEDGCYNFMPTGTKFNQFQIC